MLSGESEQLSLFLDASSGLDDPKLPTGRMTWIYDLKGDGTFQRKSQGFGEVYGTWAWDVSEGVLVLSETTTTNWQYNVNLDDPDLTGNLDVDTFINYQNMFGNNNGLDEYEVLDTVRLQLVNGDQPASYWVMDGTFTTEIMLRSLFWDVDLTDVVRDPSQPIIVRESEGSKVHVGLGNKLETMVSQELIGTWAIEMPLPWLEPDHCRTCLLYTSPSPRDS